MKHKTVLITGASSGIGKATGIFLTKKGYKVYGTTRDKTKYPNFKEFTLIAMDVTKPDTIRLAINEILKEEKVLHIVVNNAGIGITGPLEETPNEAILNAFDTNFNGPLNVIKAVLPQMRKQNDGLIINITSIAGYMGLPYRGVYSATKGALELITESLRLETKDFGIKFACLAPGDFATNIASGRYHAPVLENSPYEIAYESILKSIDNDVENGGNPLQVAKKVYEIITTTNPRIHYKVGSFLQRFSVVLKLILPDIWYEKLLAKHSLK